MSSNINPMPPKIQEATESFSKAGQKIEKGKKRLRVNLDASEDPRLAIAAKEALKFDTVLMSLINGIRSLKRMGRYVTVETTDGKTVDLNINSLAKRLHLTTKEIKEAAKTKEGLTEFLNKINFKELEKGLKHRENPEEYFTEFNKWNSDVAEKITNCSLLRSDIEEIDKKYEELNKINQDYQSDESKRRAVSLDRIRNSRLYLQFSKAIEQSKKESGDVHKPYTTAITTLEKLVQAKENIDDPAQVHKLNSYIVGILNYCGGSNTDLLVGTYTVAQQVLQRMFPEDTR